MNKLDQSRRAALKKLGLGSGLGAAGFVLPTAWTTPIVRTVVLPAHATATGINGSFADDRVITQQQSLSSAPSLLNLLVPTAHASSYVFANVCMDITGSVADVFVEFWNSLTAPGLNRVMGVQGVSLPFGYMDLMHAVNPDASGWAMNGQPQTVDGELLIVGNIRKNRNLGAGPPDYEYYPYAARMVTGSCGLTITPPTPP